MVDVKVFRIPSAEAMAQIARRNGEVMFGWPPDAACHLCGDTGERLPGEICVCPAGTAARQRRADAERTEQIQRGWAEAGFPTRVRAWRLETSPNAAFAHLVADWCDSAAPAEGGTLLLTGEPGTGKTGLAVGAARRLHEADPSRTVRWWVAPDLLDRLRPGSEENGMACLTAAKTADVLVFDEMTIETSTAWVKERIYVLINDRYLERRPTIVTSNHDLPRISEALGSLLVSRLTEAPSEVIRVDGPDYRQLPA